MGRRLPEFLNWADAERLLQVASTERDRFIVSLGLFCGLRVAEMVALRRGDVNVHSATLFVRQGKGAKDRYVPIPRRALAQFRSYLLLRVSSEVLLPSRREGGPPGRGISARGIRYRLVELGRAAGLQGSVHPHMLRHTYATTLLEQGADLLQVRDLLGHASVATTEIYLHCLPERLRLAADRLGASWAAPQLRLFGA